MTNEKAATTLFGIANLLEAQGANPYRVRSYRRAARFLQKGANHDVELPWLSQRLRRKLTERGVEVA